MLVINTTFHVENPLVEEFLTWVRNSYFAEASAAEGIGSPVLMRLLVEVDPEATSFAVQLSARDLATAECWHDTEGARLRDEFVSRRPGRIVFFTTYMEVLTV